VELLDQVFEGKDIGEPKCETDAVDKSIKLAQKLGIGGTPAIIFPDGRLLPGYVNADALEQLIGK
jgi:thiol:disulfide interchange protein DsbC